jgi:multiple sugar transport system substrate-binding protein
MLQTSMRRRRFLQTLGAASGAALLGTTGVATLARAAKATTIRFFNNETDPNTIAFLKQMSQEYKDTTGVSIEVETVPVLQTWTKVTTAIKAGKPYDFITFGQVTEPLLLAEEQKIVPLTNLIRDVGEADFGPRALTLYQNDYWMYPYDYNFNYLFYRKDWFAEKGLQVPNTWDEFLHVLAALNDPGNKRYAYTMPVASGGHTNWGNTGWLWAAGVEIYDEEWNVILDSDAIKPRAVKTLEFLLKAAQYTPPGLVETSLKDMLINFTSGLSAITTYTGRLIHTIEDRAPELADKYGIMAYPAPEGGRRTVTFANDGFSIGKTPNTEATLEFFKWFLNQGKLVDYQLTVAVHYQPPQYSTYKNEKWRAHPLIQKHWAAIEVMLDFMNTDKTQVGSIQLQGPGPSPNQGRIWTSDVLPRMYQQVLLKQLTPSQAVDAAAKEIREFTKKA